VHADYPSHGNGENAMGSDVVEANKVTALTEFALHLSNFPLNILQTLHRLN